MEHVPPQAGIEEVEELLEQMQAAVASLRWRISQLQVDVAVRDEQMALRFLSDISTATMTSMSSNSTNNTSYGDEIESDPGSVAFLLFCTLSVLLMTTPGIMLYYSGLARLQNSLSTAIQAYVITSLVATLWLLLGYSICFGSTSQGGVIGSMDRAWLRGVSNQPHPLAPGVPEYVFCSFHLAFAVITPSLICGAFANRMKFRAVVAFLALWHLVVYCPIVHCFWHADGWLARWGVQDFAGGCVVHISAGFSALVSALMVGKRRVHKRIRLFHPHNKIISATGACFLNIGWYGFNAGSALSANPQACIAFLNTQIACGAASLTWMFIDILLRGVPSFDGIMNGTIAGLVAITPCAGYVDVTGAFIVGILGGAVTSQGIKIKIYCRFDDALDAFGIHGIAGMLGVVMTGLLSRTEVSGAGSDQEGLFYGGPAAFLGKQLVAIVFTIVWGCVWTAVILKLVDRAIGLRVSQAKELMGLDTSEHGKTSSQMQKVPALRRVKSEDSVSSLRSFSSNSSSGSGDVGEGAVRCWPWLCMTRPLPAAPASIVSRGHSSHSSSSESSRNSTGTSSSGTLTIENKRAHDKLAENKKMGVAARLERSNSAPVEEKDKDKDKDKGTVGGLKKNSTSFLSFGELNMEIDDSDFKLNINSALENEQSSGLELVVQSQPDEEDDDFFVGGCDLDEDDDNLDDYDLDTSQRGTKRR